VLAAGLWWAVLGAALNTASGILQSDATRFVRPGRPVVRQPRYLAGLTLDGLGWLCAVAALQHLPVVLVQSVLACGVVLTVYAARFRYAVVLRRRDHVAAVACTAGLALVASATGTDAPFAVSGWTVAALASAAVLLAAAVAGTWDAGRGWPLGVLTGLAFGGTALVVRADHVDDAGTLPFPLAVALVAAYGITGVAARTRALELTGVARLAAIVSVTQTMVPGAAGILALGDPVRPGWGWALAAGVLLAASGVLVLAGSPGLRPPPTALRGRRKPRPGGVRRPCRRDHRGPSVQA
jgi:hypothetical protein